MNDDFQMKHRIIVFGPTWPIVEELCQWEYNFAGGVSVVFGNAPRLPPPRPVALAAALDALYHASTSVEEGRPCRPRLIFRRSVEATAWRFLEPRPMSVELLRKLSPAVGAGAYAVDISGEVPLLWGIAPFVESQYPFAEAVGSGRLVLGQGSVIAAIVGAGEVIKTKVDRSRLNPLVTAAIASAQGDERAVLKAATLLSIVRSMHRQGHGGAILFPRAEDQDGWLKDLDRKYAIDPSFAAALGPQLDRYDTAAQTYAKWSAEGQPDTEAAREHPIWAYQDVLGVIRESKHVLAAIGQLTAVDGATVLDSDFRIQGFGVTIKTEVDSPAEAIAFAEQSNGSSITIRSLGGHRHSSAARFVAAHPSTVAFVASTDGALTMFCRDNLEKPLKAYRQLEYLI